MNKIINCTILIFCFVGYNHQSGNAQDFNYLLESKSYNTFAKHLDDTITIEIDRKKVAYKKEEALNIIKKHLAKFNPVKWERMHQGESEGSDANYQILKAYNASGNSLRIFLYTKSVGSRSIVSTIKFRKAL